MSSNVKLQYLFIQLYNLVTNLLLQICRGVTGQKECAYIIKILVHQTYRTRAQESTVRCPQTNAAAGNQYLHVRTYSVEIKAKLSTSSFNFKTSNCACIV